MLVRKFDLIIIGAGLSGLMAAAMLTKYNRQILLLDKGRSVGGRLATRRIGPGRADHGAQFFTVRDERFRAHVDRWLADELVFEWSRGWSNGSADDAPPDGYPRYAVRGGMNALAKRLAADLTPSETLQLKTNAMVTGVLADGTHWDVQTAAGDVFTAATLLLTTPVPQSLALLDAGGVTLTPADRNALEHVEYAPCLCGLAWVEGNIALPAPGAIQHPNLPVSWIANNQAKGISPDASIITIHAGPELSRMLYDEADEVIEPVLVDALSPYLAAGASIRQFQLKRWRYALPTVLFPDRFLQATDLPPLFFAGDAFGGPRVEGAALSGIYAGEAILTSEL